MNNASTFDRLVLCGLALFVITTFLASCISGAATTVVSRTLKTASKATAAVVRLATSGTNAASDTVARSLRGNEQQGMS
ncbi:MAG: hypothetical protein AAGF14_04085 [Pseudomonadota bacterium]